MNSRAILVAALLALACGLVSGCDGALPGLPGGDAGAPGDGGAGDAGTRGDASGGRDAFSTLDAARECRTDADCEDGDPLTHAYCQVFFGQCISAECNVDPDCVDTDPCTLDYCLNNTCRHGFDGTCCTSAADCVDAYDCTIDTCVSDHCVWTPTPACGTSCPDNDHDGSGATFCGGTDCDDFDPMRSATLPENCMNSIDDDCDGAVDAVDTSCRPPNLTCPGTPIGAEMTHGLTVSAGSGVTTGCGSSAFYTVTLAATSDVEIIVTLDRPPPPCPTCPPAGGPMQLNYRAFLETTCGDTATDVLGSVGGCNYWDPSGGGFFSGLQTSTYSRRRVPAGSYTIEIQAGPMFAFMTGTTGFTVSAHATPSVDATCDGEVLTPASTVRGDSTDGLDAFGTTCRGAVIASPERLHPFTLAARSRVRVTATPDPFASGGSPPIRVAVLSACDAASASRLDCAESSGSSCQDFATVEHILEAGTYEALVERRDGGAGAYDLSLVVEPAGAACEGASVISTSGMTSGTTAGGIDHFRDDRVCGDASAPDVVYRLEIAVPSRVVLDLIASYMSPRLRVYRGCGEARVAGGDSPRIDTTLEAGSYEVVVDGAGPSNAGGYILSTTIVPM